MRTLMWSKGLWKEDEVHLVIGIVKLLAEIYSSLLHSIFDKNVSLL